jgi:hypothetical protein
MRKFIHFVILVVFLTISSPAIAEQYCMNRWWSKYEQAQSKINYLVRERNRTSTREAYNSFNSKIDNAKNHRDYFRRKYERCDERSRELCSYPKVPTVRFPTTRHCIEYFIAAGSLE